MDVGLMAALVGGGSIAGVIIDRFVQWLLSRRAREVTLADQSTIIAERMLVRMEAQLAVAESQMAAANTTINKLHGEVAQLRSELATRAIDAAEIERLSVENARLKAHITNLTGGTP